MFSLYSIWFSFSVAGKDVVPRVGLHQLETLRHDLMDAIKRSKKNKVRWREIFKRALKGWGTAVFSKKFPGLSRNKYLSNELIYSRIHLVGQYL
jgi:hypothetical protein